MKTLRLPFGLGGVVGCAAWVVCLAAGMAGAQQQAPVYDPTIEVPVTFYDFHSDRSNPEFEQPHSGGSSKTTGMVEENLDVDGKPVAAGSNAYLNHGIRFWFRDNSRLNDTIYKQRVDPRGAESYPSGRNYLTKFRPIYTFDGNVPPNIRTTFSKEWEASVRFVKNAYSPADGNNSNNNSVDTAYKNTVIPAKLVFSHTGGGVYKFESEKFFPLNRGNNTFVSDKNNDNKVIFNSTSPTALTAKSWIHNNSEDDRNFAYTMELVTDFQMSDGLTFNFRGDDDVWLFINKKLVKSVDVGGIHNPMTGDINLNSIRTTHDLVNGKAYKMHLFYCERHSTGSNILITTNIVSNRLSDITFNMTGGDIVAGVDKKVTATVKSDTGTLTEYPGSFTWTVRDSLGFNTTGGTNPQLTVKPVTGNDLTKTNEVNVNAKKAYTWVILRGCYQEKSAGQVCKDTLMWVGPGPADKVWIEATQDSISANLRDSKHLSLIRIGQEVFVENFFGILRDQFGNWVRRAASGTIWPGMVMTWNSLTDTVATADTASGRANFLNATENNIPKSYRGQGRANRVRPGRSYLVASYKGPNISTSLKTDTTEIIVEDVTYTKIRVVVKQGNSYVPITTSETTPGTVVMDVRTDTTLYVQVFDPLYNKGLGQWVLMPATWTVANVPSVTAPAGSVNSFTVSPTQPTTVSGGGTLTAVSNNLTVTARLIVEQKDPVLAKIFIKRGQPDLSAQISSYTLPLPGNFPTTAQGYVEPERFVAVTAGAKLPLVGKLFSERVASVDTWLKDLENPSAATDKNKWAWSFVSGSPTNAGVTGTASALSGTTGDSVTFNSTVAHQQYRVKMTYTDPGKATVTQEIIIEVVPDVRTEGQGGKPTVSIERELQMTDANKNTPLKVPELAFAAGETEKPVYAILRDQYGNYIAPSGASIPAAWGFSVTVKKPSWTPLDNAKKIVYAVNGQSVGQGNVIKNGDITGAAVYVVVYDSTFGKKDSVLARLLNYYYTEIQIVTECARSDLTPPVNGYCKVPESGINMTTNDEERIFVIGKCSDTTKNCDGKGSNGWELVPGDWDRDGGLTSALTSPPSGTNNWTLTPTNTGDGTVTVKRPGPGDSTLTAQVPVKITAGSPNRAEIKIITPPEERIAGKPIQFEITYFNTTGEMKEWGAWPNDSAYFADILQGLGVTTIEPKIVDGYGGKNTLFYVGKDGNGKVNAQLTHALVNGKDVVTVYIYNAADGKPHQIKYMETVNGKKLEAVSEQFIVLPGEAAKIVIVDNNTGKPLDDDITLSFNGGDQIWKVVAYDSSGNKIGDYPSNWNASTPVKVDEPNRPVLVYVPSRTDEGGCGDLIVTGVANPNLKDTLRICITGVVTSPYVKITRDYDGCGYLDRIEMKFRKSVKFMGEPEGTKEKTVTDKMIKVTHGRFTFKIDKVTVIPDADSVIIWLNDDVKNTDKHGGSLQTGWKPTVEIFAGFLEGKNSGGDYSDVGAQKVETTDGAAPVIATAQFDLTDNKSIWVTFSESVKPAEIWGRGKTFGPLGDLNNQIKPNELFNIWVRGQSKALQARTQALSKKANDVNTNTVFTPRINVLDGIEGIYRENDSVLRFELADGMKVGPPSDYINIRTGDQEDPVRVDVTPLTDRVSESNKPTWHNRKVLMTYKGSLNGTLKPVPNPASPDANYKDAPPGVINAFNDSKALEWIKKGDLGGAGFEVPIYVPGEFELNPDGSQKLVDDGNGNMVPVRIPANKRAKIWCRIQVYDLAGNLVITGQSSNAITNPEVTGSTTLQLYWNGYNSKAMKVAPGTYRLVVTIKYLGNLQAYDQNLAKPQRHSGLVGISK